MAGADFFVAKYAPDGSLVWVREVRGSSSENRGLGIAVDSTGNSYVTGFFNLTATFGAGEDNETVLVATGSPDVFVAKYASNGNMLWAKQAGGTWFAHGYAIAVDGTGNSHITGTFSNAAVFGEGETNETTLTSAGLGDIFVAKYSEPDSEPGPIEENQPPVADAGEDQCVPCTSAGATEVTLDGSGSVDPDGDPLTYTWTGPFPEGDGTVGGVSPTVTLPVGMHTITLVVNDGTVDSDSDTVNITVKVLVTGLQPPLAGLVEEGNLVPVPPRAFKRGSTLPLRLRMFCGTTALTDADVAPPRIVGLSRETDPLDIEELDLDSGQSAEGGLEFRYSDGNWVYNLSTRELSTGTYIVTIELPDGKRYQAAFVLR